MSLVIRSRESVRLRDLGLRSSSLRGEKRRGDARPRKGLLGRIGDRGRGDLARRGDLGRGGVLPSSRAGDLGLGDTRRLRSRQLSTASGGVRSRVRYVIGDLERLRGGDRSLPPGR